MKTREAVRVKLVVQYDGTPYAGFQKQKNATTVQGVLEKALEKLLKHPVTVRAAGRTDSGVHARGQVIVFDSKSPIPPSRIPDGLIKLLPETIIVSCAEQVALDFNPMKNALSKTYCYRIWRKKHMPIMIRPFVLWYYGSLDYDLMVEEAREFLGKNDFANFRALGSSAKTTVRNIKEVKWVQKDIDGQGNALWEFWVSADGFLYKMIRLMVGTLIDVGRGYLPRGTVKNALEAARANEGFKVGKCVSGKGLCLEKVCFS